MKINRNNQDLKIINYSRGYICDSCAFANNYAYPCILFCRPGKVWIKEICNSDIFRL